VKKKKKEYAVGKGSVTDRKSYPGAEKEKRPVHLGKKGGGGKKPEKRGKKWKSPLEKTGTVGGAHNKELWGKR